MTPEEKCLHILKEQAAKPVTSREEPHLNADAALCEFLRDIGHGKIADAFEAVPKWYS